MARRVFSKCLNEEAKIYNCSYGSLFIGGFTLLVVGLMKGIVWGAAFSVGGFFLGNFLSREWYLGNIQRFIYWRLPFAKILIDKNMPESHHRHTM